MTLFQELPTVSVCQPRRVGGINSESRRDWLMLEKSLHSEISLVCARREVRLIDWGGGSAGKALGDY